MFVSCAKALRSLRAIRPHIPIAAGSCRHAASQRLHCISVAFAPSNSYIRTYVSSPDSSVAFQISMLHSNGLPTCKAFRQHVRSFQKVMYEPRSHVRAYFMLCYSCSEVTEYFTCDCSASYTSYRKLQDLNVGRNASPTHLPHSKHSLSIKFPSSDAGFVVLHRYSTLRVPAVRRFKRRITAHSQPPTIVHITYQVVQVFELCRSVSFSSSLPA